MSRRQNIEASKAVEVSLPYDVAADLDLYLWSEVQRRVPYGAYRDFFTARIKEFFGWKHIPLEPYGFPQGFFITGPAEMVEAVVARLKGEKL